MAGKRLSGRSVGQAQISAFRLRRHHLLERSNAPLTTICGDVCGIQAQVMSAGAVYKRVYRNQGWISPVLLVDGRVVGVWSHTRRANGLILDVELFEKTAKPPQAALEEATASLGAFLGAPCQLKIAQ